MEGMIWALIIVTGTANVNISTGYPSKALCEDAISIAKYGMTVAEKTQADEDYARKERELDAAYAAVHPDREANDQDRRVCNHSSRNGSRYSDGSVCTVDDDTGIVHFHRKAPFGATFFGSSDPAREIKSAKCVLIDPKDK